MKYNQFQIGDRIKSERERLGMSQDAFGSLLPEKSGDDSLAQVGRGVIYAWESGSRLPSLAQMFALCKVFDCELGYLLCEKGYENRTRTATDMCEETGLSEDAVNTLVRYKALIEKHNLLEGHRVLPGYDEYALHFISYFIENGRSVLRQSYNLFTYQARRRTYEENPYWQLAMEAYENSINRADRSTAFKALLKESILESIKTTYYPKSNDPAAVQEETYIFNIQPENLISSILNSLSGVYDVLDKDESDISAAACIAFQNLMRDFAHGEESRCTALAQEKEQKQLQALSKQVKKQKGRRTNGK